MKKSMIILLTGILFAISARGQIAKGTWMMGGNATFSAIDSRDPVDSRDPINTATLTIVSIAPDIGYFVFEKFALGMDASYEMIAGKNNNVSQTTQHAYAFGPFVRYYILPSDHVVNLFAGASYQHYILDPGNSISDTYSIFAGPTAFFNSSVAMEITAGFSSLRTKRLTTNSLVINAGFHIYFKKQ